MHVLYTKADEESLLTSCYSRCETFKWRIYSVALSLSCDNWRASEGAQWKWSV